MTQVLYILIVCLFESIATPNTIIGILAMVWGGHLLSFARLYQSKRYTIPSVMATLESFTIGRNFSAWIIALFILIFEIILQYISHLKIKNDELSCLKNKFPFISRIYRSQ